MTVVKAKKKFDGTKTAHLDNGIIVKVKRLSEQEQLRAASTFNPKTLSRVNRNNQNVTEGMELWQGNEAYLLFVVERSCTLVTEMPDPVIWLGPYRRNHRSYGIEPDELDDPVYLAAIYIRFEGMTTDDFVSAVTDMAMGIQSDLPEEPVLQLNGTPGEPDEEDEEDDEEDESQLPEKLQPQKRNKVGRTNQGAHKSVR